jgi:hypothetical protein
MLRRGRGALPAAVDFAVAAAAHNKIEQGLGAGRCEEETCVVGGARRVRDNIERFGEVWAEYKRVHGTMAGRLLCQTQLEADITIGLGPEYRKRFWGGFRRVWQNRRGPFIVHLPSQDELRQRMGEGG